MVIDPENKFYKTWIEDKGWRVLYSFALPRITKKGNLGYRWQEDKKKLFATEKEAEYFYNITKKELEVRHLNKEIVVYRIYKHHITILKTICPKCGKDADILTFMMIIGTDMNPQCPIVCKNCANKDKYSIDNTVGVYYFKDNNEFLKKSEYEKEFYEDRIIITKEDYERKQKNNFKSISGK